MAPIGPNIMHTAAFAHIRVGSTTALPQVSSLGSRGSTVLQEDTHYYGSTNVDDNNKYALPSAPIVC